MAKQHGKDTVIKLDSKDLSIYCNASEIQRTADVHDTTGYSPSGGAHEYEGGLTDGKATFGGVYDTTALTGPRAVIEPLIGLKKLFVRQIEGTGTGKPQDSVQAVVVSYVETSPVADMVTWSVELQLSGAVDSTPQA